MKEKYRKYVNGLVFMYCTTVPTVYYTTLNTVYIANNDIVTLFNSTFQKPFFVRKHHYLIHIFLFIIFLYTVVPEYIHACSFTLNCTVKISVSSGAVIV